MSLKNPSLWAVAVTAVTLTLASRPVVAEDKGPPPQVVKKILKVEYTFEKIAPPNLVVTVEGQVNTGGYTNVTLKRATYVTPPKDGIQDYTLYATPPDGIALQVISTVTAKDTWKAYPAWVKGVRVRGVDGGIVVKKFDEK